MEGVPVKVQRSWLMRVCTGLLLVLVGVCVDRFVFTGARSASSSDKSNAAASKAAATDAAESAHTPQPADVTNRMELDPGLLRREVRQAVAQALDERITVARAAPAASAALAKESSPTLANRLAFQAGEDVLARAVERKLWTRADAAEFHAALRGATLAQRREMQMKLVQNINRGELQFDP